MFPFILLLLATVLGHSIQYNITGGSVTNMTLDYNSNALLININATHNGVLGIDFSCSLLDTNSTFIIVHDGVLENSSGEIDSSTDRQIIIPFNSTD